MRAHEPPTQLIVATMLLPYLARATMRVLAGPAELVGLEFPTSAFGCSTLGFDVTANTTYIPGAHWSYGRWGLTCPPNYVGELQSDNLRGRVLITDDRPASACSQESHARYAASVLGAAVLGVIKTGGGLGQSPGAWKYQHLTHDIRRPGSCLLPTMDVGGPEAAPFTRALRTGVQMRVRLAAGETAWDTHRAHPAWSLLFALCALHALAVIELAACRLYAFWRHEGGLRLSLAHVLLALELLCNSMRLMLAVDRHRLSDLPDWLWTACFFSALSIGAMTTVLYLSYFVHACASSGIASLYLSRGVHASVIIGTLVCILLCDAAGYVRFITADRTVNLFAVQVNFSTIVLPGSVLLACVWAWWRVHASKEVLGAMTPKLLERLRISIAASAISFMTVLLYGRNFTKPLPAVRAPADACARSGCRGAGPPTFEYCLLQAFVRSRASSRPCVGA